MATFSLNTTIKISTGISVTGANPSYSVPANSYAVVNCYSPSSGFAVTIGGGSVTLAISSAANQHFDSLYIGPGQTVQLSGAAAGSSITGVQFINSP